MVELIPKLKKITPIWWEFQWDEKPSEKLLNTLLALNEWLWDQYGNNLKEARQGYQCLSLIWKKPPSIDIELSFPSIDLNSKKEKATWKIPVCYGGKFGKDLERLCKEKKLTEKEFIELHSKTSYRLDFYGFLPGFMYLSGLDESLSFPRKQFPERVVKAGSVGIGGNQTGIYPIDSPGGWQLIGKTPISVFSPFENPPVKPKVGDQIVFVPITEDEFEQLKNNPFSLQKV
ncbi:5-oxoprolinase subunit PxpB [Algoriphagus limi]|uniref:5-oxoprolinase subunit PxpB n=1 Tax=Algoriphagus limi TaxID=2975273 RepID=A0ABT2G3Q7_9BACT|nr:5-oxoprolinase subunit PxpB [Algoriphagus limi]MCS5489717.1 5-oxoprolinase subunit PxpB [Algoriphagus limi]